LISLWSCSDKFRHLTGHSRRRTAAAWPPAEAADLSGNYISDLELGLKVPSLTTLVRLSQALDVAAPDLLIDFSREAVKKMKVRSHRI